MRLLQLLEELKFRRSPKAKVALLLAALGAAYCLRKGAQRLRKKPLNEPLARPASIIRAASSIAHKLGFAEEPLGEGVEESWKTLMRFGVPPLFSKTSWFALLLLTVLIIRTLLSIWIASIHGSIVRALVGRNLRGFLGRLAVLLVYSFPAALSNGLIEFLERRLALQVRERVTRWCLSKYLSGKTFYQMANLDLRITHPEHRLTRDIDLWSRHLASLCTTLTKPVIDIVIISRVLINSTGIQGPVLIAAWYLLSGLTMRLLSPDFATMAGREEKLEAAYRSSHSSVVKHAEEIAFYKGNQYELNVLQSAFDQITSHLRRSSFKRLLVGIYDSLLVKYGAFLIGYVVVSLPIFAYYSTTGLDEGSTTSKITQDYVRHSSLLISLAKAIGRLVASQKQIQSFVGYCTLIGDFADTLESLGQGHLRTAYAQQGLRLQRELRPQEVSAFREKGIVVESPNIEFVHVPIVTPDGHTLVRDVTFKVSKGQHLFLLGPNGSGKSSLFRILGGLWPVSAGELHAPNPSCICYVPQRPYMPIGTLRDQVIYPDIFRPTDSGDRQDKVVEGVLAAVGMGRLLHKGQKGLETQRAWDAELSGGEKQRIAIARLCYHRPTFAVLDEATSAVSADHEGSLFRLCQSYGVTLITISHRLSLLQYHTHLLKFDGAGNCEFIAVTSELLGSLTECQVQMPKTPYRSPSRRLRTASPSLDAELDSEVPPPHRPLVDTRTASQQFLTLQQSFSALPALPPPRYPNSSTK